MGSLELSAQVKKATAVFQDSRSGALDVILVIDESTSITVEHWQMVLLIARNCTLFFDFDENPSNPKVRMGLIKYNTEATVVSAFNHSRTTLCQIISGLKQTGGGTNLLEPLKLADKMFNMDQRVCAKMMIIFTDEDVADDAVNFAQTLLAKDISILCFSIGRCNVQKASQLSSPRGAYFLKDWNETLALFDGINLKPFDPPTLTVYNRSPEWVGFEVHSEGYERVEFEVYDADTKQKAKSYTFAFSSSRSYLLEGMPNDKLYEATARVIYKSGASGAFGPKLRFRTMKLHHERELLKDKSALKHHVSLMRSGINGLDLKDTACLNLLLLGLIGKGKSSLLNTGATALADEEVDYCRFAVTNDILTSVTKDLLKWSVNTKGNINVWDIFGQDGTNYDAILNFLLGGNLKDGYKEGTDVNEMYDPSPSIEDMPHCICIVFSANALCTAEELKKVKVFFDKLAAKEFQPLVILTKLDLEEATNLRPGSLETIWDNPIVDAMIETFVQGTGISRSFVFPVINYTGQNQRNDIQDKLVLNALDCAVKEAKNRIRYLIKTRFPPRPPSLAENPPKVTDDNCNNNNPGSPRCFFVKKANSTERLRVGVSENILERLREAVAAKFNVKISQVGSLYYVDGSNEPVTIVDNDDVEFLPNQANVLANISD